jgi:cadmium resistance protein CadD (predicted permease)
MIPLDWLIGNIVVAVVLFLVFLLSARSRDKRLKIGLGALYGLLALILCAYGFLMMAAYANIYVFISFWVQGLISLAYGIVLTIPAKRYE